MGKRVLLFLLFWSAFVHADVIQGTKKYTDIDFNNDGIADILWRKESGNYLWYMKSNGKHAYKNIGRKPSEFKIKALADFNNDGVADILWRKESGNYLWYMKSDGKHAYKNIGRKPIEYSIVFVADFNNDGIADILWKKDKYYSLWYMKSNGKHSYKYIGSKPINYHAEAVADFNNDGISDILWKKDKYYSLWYMKSNGKHTYKYIGSKPTTYHIEAVADFNNDGIADIFWKKEDGNYLWYMKSTGKHTYKNIGRKTKAYSVKAVSDFNNDGIADILWKKEKYYSLWYMTDKGKHKYKYIGSKPETYSLMLSQNQDVEQIVEEVPLIKGYLLDSPVEGVEYECNQRKGLTLASGEFSCVNAPVTFSIGNLVLGTINNFTSDTKVYPQDLLGLSRENFEDADLINLIRVIQSLDNDGNISQNISIPASAKSIFTEDASALNFEIALALLGDRVVSESDALAHLKREMSAYLPFELKDLNVSVNENDTVSFNLNEQNVSNAIFSKVSEPLHGTVEFFSGQAKYIPNQSFAGVDSFTYRLYDGKTYSNISTINIKVHNFTVLSTSYRNGGNIPLKHVCGYYRGSNMSPHFQWDNAPINTKSYALIMDDEVSPCGRGINACKHWGLFNIPSTINDVSENINILTIEGSVEGLNYNGSHDYEGPCPPNGHKYKTTVYALSEDMPKLSTSIGITRSQFASQYRNYILNSATMYGWFTP